MRHGDKIKNLSRKSAHRQALLSNLAASLILNKKIRTTLGKAKALRKYVEPIITRSKSDTTHSRRMVFRYLQNKLAVTALFRDVASKVADRPGGYTRILKTGPRPGDNAEMALIELVDFNEARLTAGKSAPAKAKITRRGRGKKKAEVQAEAEPAAKEAKENPTEKADGAGSGE